MRTDSRGGVQTSPWIKPSSPNLLKTTDIQAIGDKEGLANQSNSRIGLMIGKMRIAGTKSNQNSPQTNKRITQKQNDQFSFKGDSYGDATSQDKPINLRQIEKNKGQEMRF